MSDSQASTSAGRSASSIAYPPSDDSSELESKETLTTDTTSANHFVKFIAMQL